MDDDGYDAVHQKVCDSIVSNCATSNCTCNQFITTI